VSVKYYISYLLRFICHKTKDYVIWETLKGEGGEEKYQVGENRTYIHTFELSSGNVLHFRIKKLP